MKAFKLLVPAVLIAVLAMTGTALADDNAVQVTKKADLGSYLTDVKGMTLYTFAMDSPGSSACEGPCVDNWPLFYREKVEPKDGLAAKDFGTITRGDGKKQTTYKGMPLYFFIKDKKPGDTMGQGVKDAWAVAKP